MESKNIVWRPSPTVCRCCFNDGCYKDISTEYFWMGKREIYSEMLTDTLDVSISYSQSGGPNSNSRLICEPCIARLRDASDFKKQVLECEKMFLLQLNPDNDSVPSEELGTNESQMKTEEVKIEKLTSVEDFPDSVDFGGTQGEDNVDDDDDLDDEPLTKLASKIPKKEKVDLMDLVDNVKATEKRKSSSKAKSSPAKKAKTKSKTEAAQPSSSGSKVVPKKQKGTPTPTYGKTVSANALEWNKVPLGHRKNAELILTHSTALPFKTVWSKFSCPHCFIVFEDITFLWSHISDSHKNDSIKNVFYKLSDNLVNVDITDLKCRLCKQEVLDVDMLHTHLADKHNVYLNRTFSNGVMPFKRLENKWVCVFCEQVFLSFKDVKRHTPNHIKNFVCDNCNSSFVTDQAYKTHVAKQKCFTSHELRFTHQLDHRKNARIIVQYSTVHPFRLWNNKLSCVLCRDLFTNPVLLRSHLDNKHKHYSGGNVFYKCLRKDFLKVDITDLKCRICSQDFDNIESIAYHLKIEHKKAIELKSQLGVLAFKLNFQFWKCIYCSDEFTDCQSLVRHTSEHFMNYVCDSCGEGFITKQALTIHSRIPHENIYPCYRCTATFSSLEDRKSHTKEKHTKTPYCCYVCDHKPRFTTWDSKQKHMLETHDVEPSKYDCHECGAVFAHRSTRYKHARKVHAVKEFSCKYCNKHFTSNIILQNHIVKKHYNNS